ncbi:MAG TPA: hypothetical protein PKD53_23485, partial [Chloroflexaceae bacterium]|nr:hypothetical protein [Chloroflexaceae bacterium]
FDKPVVVGEFPANASGSGMSVHQMLESIFGNCYAGAWSWGYHRVDSNGGWTDTAPGMAQFNSAHRAEVAIGGSAPPAPTSPAAPTSAPPPPTSAPTQPTSVPPQPTAAPPAPTPPSASGAETMIYADALAPGWQNWSWGSSINLNSGTVVREGTRAIQVTHLAPWAALRLHAERPLLTAGHKTLRFWLHGGATGGQALQLYVETGIAMSLQVRLPAPEANRWTLVEVPLARLGSPAQITDLAIQEAGGATGRPFFVDQLSLVAVGVAPQPAPANGQRIYDDALAQGWANWSWGVSVRLDDRTRVRSGERAIAATFQHAWAGLKLHHQTGVDTASSAKIRLWLHGGERGGQQLQVYVLNGNGWSSPMARLPALPANRWTLIEVPLAQLGSPARITDLILHERAGPNRDTVYVDDIQLAP